MTIKQNEKIANQILSHYGLNAVQKKEFWDIARYIFEHDEFQRRMSSEFPHHGEITLGEHILSDAAQTYKLMLNPKFNKANFDKKIAVVIALFHDLYTLNWQNNPENWQEYDYNGHAFRHPLEAIINAISWYPEYFTNEKEAYKIIDGVIHHMFPVPVKRFDHSPMELKNEKLWSKIADKNKKLIIFSSNRGFKYQHFSLCPSSFLEGRIMSKADKMVSVSNYLDDLKQNGLSGIIALFTGGNKNLSNHEALENFKKRR